MHANKAIYRIEIYRNCIKIKYAKRTKSVAVAFLSKEEVS